MADEFKPLEAAAEAQALTFDERQTFLGGLTEEQRDALHAAVPEATKEAWVREELEHLQELTKDQPTEGAEFPEAEPIGTAELPGAEAPQDRAPDVGKDLIEMLVNDKFAAYQDANKERARAERLQHELDAACAELDRYYQAFGKLPED